MNNEFEFKREEAMTLDEYQEKAMSTCMPTCKNYAYMMGNLIAEVGKFPGIVSKMTRKGYLTINDDNVTLNLGDDAEKNNEINKMYDDLIYEAGDILWHLSGLC